MVAAPYLARHQRSRGCASARRRARAGILQKLSYIGVFHPAAAMIATAHHGRGSMRATMAARLFGGASRRSTISRAWALVVFLVHILMVCRRPVNEVRSMVVGLVPSAAGEGRMNEIILPGAASSLPAAASPRHCRCCLRCDQRAPVVRKILSMGEEMNCASQRALIDRNALAREFSRADRNLFFAPTVRAARRKRLCRPCGRRLLIGASRSRLVAGPVAVIPTSARCRNAPRSPATTVSRDGVRSGNGPVQLARIRQRRVGTARATRLSRRPSATR